MRQVSKSKSEDEEGILKAQTRLISLLTLLALLASSSAPVFSQAEQKVEMGTFYVCLVVKNPRAPAEHSSEAGQVMRAHLKHLESLVANGKAVVVGPFPDGGRILGIVVMGVQSADEARTLEEADPLVKTGLASVEVLKWWAAKGVMKPPATPFDLSLLTTYYFGLIRRGPKWTADRTPEVEKLQADHMANINALAKAGKLVIAGPFENAGENAGVFVFKAGTIDEAKALADSDPAVKAGRLVVDVHPWLVLKGSLP